MKKTTRNLLIAFLLILGIKLAIIPFIHGPQLFPDEGCLGATAKHFSETLEIESCFKILGLPYADPPILNTIILSPFYGLLSKAQAFYAILIFHSILISFLIFPLFKITRLFTKSDKKSLILSSLLLFVPQFLMYEKTMLTEPLFAATNIWILFFYLNSFINKNNKYKLAAFTLAIIGIFMRPFGFITLAALLANEFTHIKKRTVKLSIIPLGIISILPVFLLSPELFTRKIGILTTIFEGNNIQIFIDAFTRQINSFTFATGFIPFVIFIGLMIGIIKPPKFIKKIKWFLITFTILSIGIGTLHLHGYLEPPSKNVMLLTRYINVPLIFIMTIGFATLISKIKIPKNIVLGTIGIILIGLLFKVFNTKDPLIIQLSLEYFELQYLEELYKIPPSTYLSIIIGPIFLILLIILLKTKKRILLTGITLGIIMTHSFFTVVTTNVLTSYTFKNNPIYQTFKNTKYKIVNIATIGKQISYDYWSIQSMTENDIENLVVIPDEENQNLTFKYYDENREYNSETFKENDYIISEYELPHKIFKAFNTKTIYEVPKE